jgi:hypothetical protein
MKTAITVLQEARPPSIPVGAHVTTVQLASATMEHTASQGMATFTSIDLDQQAAPVDFIIHQIEQVKCFPMRPYSASALARLDELRGLAVGEIDEQMRWAASLSLASVPPICVSASSGCAAITSAS